MTNLIVVYDPADWPLDIPGVEVVAARAYLTQPQDVPVMAAKLRQLMPNVHALEVKQAQICRPELRIEIEGVVDLSGE